MHPSSGQRNKFRGTESNDALLGYLHLRQWFPVPLQVELLCRLVFNLIGAKFTSELLSNVLETRDGTSCLSGISNFLQGMNLPGPML